MRIYYVSILTNKHHSVFYVGYSKDIFRRTTEHKEQINPGFTKKYNLDKLVYYEEFNDWEEAIQREKQIKRYKENGKSI